MISVVLIPEEVVLRGGRHLCKILPVNCKTALTKSYYKMDGHSKGCIQYAMGRKWITFLSYLDH